MTCERCKGAGTYHAYACPGFRQITVTCEHCKGTGNDARDPKLVSEAEDFHATRVAKGISIREVANRLNVSPVLVGEVERGKTPIPEGWTRELSEMRANR